MDKETGFYNPPPQYQMKKFLKVKWRMVLGRFLQEVINKPGLEVFKVTANILMTLLLKNQKTILIHK